MQMKTKNLVFAAISAALMVIFSQLVIPLPFTPVPFSMAVFAVFLTGSLLPMNYALYLSLIHI